MGENMAMTNAERQARYKSRRKVQGHFQAQGPAMERLDAWVSADAAHGLRVLAALRDTTAQDELDRLIMAAVNAAKQQDRPAWGKASMEILDRNVTR
jgi:hypothetical protein